MFQVGVLLFILLTGAVPQILQALINGLTEPGLPFALALLSGLLYDLLRVAPLVLLARHPAGILHPIIIAVVVWPLLITLPNLIDSFGGYSGLLSGEPLQAPHYRALSWYDPGEVWTEVAQYNGLQILALLSLYGGFAVRPGGEGGPLKVFREVGTLRLRKVLIGIILANFAAVAVFVQSRGGLVDHVMELAFGRFRALEGLGPFLALFDIGFLAMLLWICARPQDARNPVFLTLLPLVAAQQFVVAGSRSAALLVFVLIGLGWSLAANKVPWRLSLILLPVAFLSFGALNVIRTAGITNATAIEAAQDADFASIIERSREEFDLRQSLSGAVPVTADAMRTTGLMVGYTYSGAVFALVPRAVWPDKPRGPGSLYAQYFLGEEREGTAVPIGPVAEAYWNFHIIGVALIFLLYGMLLQAVLRIYSGNKHNPLVVAGFVLLATQLGVSTDQLVAIQQMAITTLLLLAIVYAFYPQAFGRHGESSGPRRLQQAGAARRAAGL